MEFRPAKYSETIDTITDATQATVNKREEISFILNKINQVKVTTVIVNTRIRLTMENIQITINAFFDGRITRQATLDDISQDLESLFGEATDLLRKHNEISDHLDNILQHARIDLSRILDALNIITSSLDTIFSKVEYLCINAMNIVTDESLESRELKQQYQHLFNFISIRM